jgi:hypothetical protein
MFVGVFYADQCVLTVNGMRSLVLVPMMAPTGAGTMARILPDLPLLLVTSLKLNVLYLSINMDSEMQDA